MTTTNGGHPTCDLGAKIAEKWGLKLHSLPHQADASNQALLGREDGGQVHGRTGVDSGFAGLVYRGRVAVVWSCFDCCDFWPLDQPGRLGAWVRRHHGATLFTAMSRDGTAGQEAKAA